MGGVGKISKLGAESLQFRVYALEDLKVILHHFYKYPLLTNKQSDYLLFKEVVNLMQEGKHFTLEGLNKIVSIKANPSPSAPKQHPRLSRGGLGGGRAVLNNRELSDNLKLR